VCWFVLPKDKGAPRRIRRRDDLKEKRSSRTEATEVVDRSDSFAAAFFGLKRIFAPYTKSLNVNADTRTRFYLETKSGSYKGKPLFFGESVSQLSSDAAVLGRVAYEKIVGRSEKEDGWQVVFQLHFAGSEAVSRAGEGHSGGLRAV
jgi:hypothetical protein